jgi:ribonuclease BN (tRNA processing enzyme)
MMRLFFLGVGSAINSRMFKSCYLIDNRILIDASPEAATILSRHDIDLGGISGILTTHLHGDHILGLPLLLTEFLVHHYKGDRFRICGPLGIERTTRDLLSLSYPEVKPDTFIVKSKASFEVLRPRTTLDFGDISVEVIPVIHGAVQSFGFYIKGMDTSLFVTGDTILCRDVIENVKRADFSLVDVTTISERLPTHMNLDDLKELQALLSEKQFLFAVHRTFPFTEPMNSIIFPKDFEAYELKTGCDPIPLKRI